MTANSGRAFDIRRQQIARVYAQALLGAAEAAGQAEEAVDELRELVGVVLGDLPQFTAVLASPRISVPEKQALLDRVLRPHVLPVVLRFLKVVCDHGRLDCLPEVQQELRKQFNNSRGILAMQVVTAYAMDDTQRSALREALEQKLGSRLDLETRVDPALIGGVVLRMGDLIYDGSVRQQLHNLRVESLRATAEKIRLAPQQFITSS